MWKHYHEKIHALFQHITQAITRINTFVVVVKIIVRLCTVPIVIAIYFYFPYDHAIYFVSDTYSSAATAVAS